MIFLRKVTIKEIDYYYLFTTKEINKVLKKFKKYIGKKEPTKEKLKTLKKEFEKQIKNNPNEFIIPEHKNVIMILQEIQNKKGFISDEDIVEMSKNYQILAEELYGIITFYSQFKLNKPGKYKIQICNGTACHVKNSNSLQKYLEKFLKIKAGNTTSNGKFSLESVNCIGACARAPAMMINGTVYGELTENKIKNILEKLK